MDSPDVPSQVITEKFILKHLDTPVSLNSPIAAERNSKAYKPYITMVSLFTSGLALAVGHHLLYSRLNGRQLAQVSVSQAWVIRAGTAFAFAFKTVLVSAIGAAYCQLFWHSVRRKSIRIGSLDAMFALLKEPMAFFKFQFAKKTALLFVMAVLAWLLPLSSILSPGALTGLFSMYP